uniref:hypothetical protein n=1 Tax=Cyanothece sp. BG0011 TaxID=2082950 RepID=UPI0030DCA2A5
MTATTRIGSNRTKSQNPLLTFWNKNKSEIIPPIIGILGFLVVWQFISMTGLIKLPPPSSLWTDERTRTLLMYPFYDRGGLDKGLFWQTLASLGRVAQGYSLAAIVGISVGILVGTQPLN